MWIKTDAGDCVNLARWDGLGVKSAPSGQWALVAWAGLEDTYREATLAGGFATEVDARA